MDPTTSEKTGKRCDFEGLKSKIHIKWEKEALKAVKLASTWQAYRVESALAFSNAV